MVRLEPVAYRALDRVAVAISCGLADQGSLISCEPGRRSPKRLGAPLGRLPFAATESWAYPRYQSAVGSSMSGIYVVPCRVTAEFTDPLRTRSPRTPSSRVVAEWKWSRSPGRVITGHRPSPRSRRREKSRRVRRTPRGCPPMMRTVCTRSTPGSRPSPNRTGSYTRSPIRTLSSSDETYAEHRRT